MTHDNHTTAGLLKTSVTTRAGSCLYHACRLSLVAVFLVSGLTKMLHPSDFASIIEAYGLIPDPLVFPAAISLIAVEIVAAAGLLFEKYGALLLITLQLLLFIAVLIFGIHLGLDIDCGCFGPNDPEAEAFHDLRGALMRDFLLLLAVGYQYFWRHINNFKPKPLFD